MKRKSNTLKKQKTSMINKKEEVKGKKEEVLPSTANTLSYQALYQNGLMQVKEDYFSQSYLLGDVNYQTVGLEDKGAIIEKYSDLINSLDDQTNFQLTIFNKRLNLEKFRQSVLYEEKEDGYDTYRKELNRMMNQNLDSGENNFSAVKLISFGRKDTNPKQAYRSLSQIGEYFKSGFSEIDARFESLAGEERVNLLADMLRGEHHLPFSYRDLTKSGQTTRHFIAPNLLDFKNKNYLQINDRLLQIVYVRDYGMELGDQFIRDLMQGDLELIVSLHAQSSTKADAMKKLRTKKTLMESQKIGEQQKLARTGIYLEKVGHVLESNIDEAEELLKTMTETGDKLFQTVFLIGVFGQDEEELKQALDTIQQVAGSNDLMIDKLPYMQEAAFNSLLPFGCDFLEGVSRSLLTSNVAVNSPWTSIDLQDRSGKYYGINQISSNIITIDRSLLNTPSGLILGTSGAGKGMATKHEIITTKIKESGENTEIIIVDPEAEYSVIGRAFGGEMIDIAPDSQTYLNVLDLSEENMDEDPVKVKSEFLLSFIGKLLDRKMDGREKSIIDRVTRLTYQSFKEPSLEEWVFVLSQQPEEEAQNLALDMELYASMQELDNPFEGKSNEDSLTMTYRYGYYDLDGKSTLQEYILLESKAHQTIVAPMDGVVSLDGDNIILTNGKGENESRLTLYSIHNGRAIEGTRVLTGDIIGETPDDTGLKVSYQKYKNKKEKLVYVNPQFYFPKVIQLQTTILPAIGQFGGDEFERAKHIYEFLKSQGASPQAIAAILGNWSVESSINPKRAEGDYLSPPVGATDSSWDNETWLAIGGPAIYSGAYPNILHRGLGLGQWTDTADGSTRHTALLNYASTQNKKWYDLDLQLDFMLHGDSPYYQSWLKDFFKNTGSAANLAQLFLTYWEGNSGDKLLERQTRATEWYYQIEKGFSQTNGGQAKSDPQSLEGVRGDLYEHSVPGGGDGMAYAYGQCTWGVAARMNQLGLKLKGRNGEKISIINTMGNGQDWVATASSLGGETGSIPRSGAIVSFVGGTHGTPADYGHVAFVEKVYDDGSFLVSETNYGGNPNYTFRKISQADSAISFAYTVK